MNKQIIYIFCGFNTFYIMIEQNLIANSLITVKIFTCEYSNRTVHVKYQYLKGKI